LPLANCAASSAATYFFSASLANLGMIELAWLGAEFMKADLGSGLQTAVDRLRIASSLCIISGNGDRWCRYAGRDLNAQQLLMGKLPLASCYRTIC